MVEDNKFAFGPGQLGKMFYPKSLAAFMALGGLSGLEKGLRTDCKAGLSVDEGELLGTVTFEEVTMSGIGTSLGGASSLHHPGRHNTLSSYPVGPDCFRDRKRVFSDNRVLQEPAPSIFWWAWEHYRDGALILLTAAALVVVALGVYRSVVHSQDEDEDSSFSWPEGVAICVAILIVVFLNAADDWVKNDTSRALI